MRARIGAFLFAAVWSAWAIPADAATLLLRPHPSADAGVIAARHGFTVGSQLGAQHLFLVEAPDTLTQADLDAIVAGDPEIAILEFSPTIPLSSTTDPALNQSIAAILEAYDYTKTFLNYYGSSAWDYYVGQPAVNQIKLREAHQLATGRGTVAIIDTGVDPYHPALHNVLLPGFDFTRGVEGGSEWNDAPELQQSIAAILEEYFMVTLNQSIAAILEGGEYPPAPLPPYFGHGTMVAGIVRLAAPTAQIMPLKVFDSWGNTRLHHIIAAVYYAADNGATVINMSFATFTKSKELQRALEYAMSKGVLSVAAIGNENLSTKSIPVWPAQFAATMGVGSVNGNKRSTFSNYEGSVTVGAPGEQLITTYPGGLYSAVWGTSFANGWLSGAFTLFQQQKPGVTMTDAEAALAGSSTSLKRTEGMGYGRLNVLDALKSRSVK
ncbi:MAG TPA: S8 family serine peptidase [Vicinamibacterales bacterium]|nr:S8 family serine peptidase [Vicinamibacterales bacterium]